MSTTNDHCAGDARTATWPAGRRRRHRLALLAAGFALAAPAWAGEFPLSGKVVRVPDGDTLTLQLSDGRQKRVRLAGIDAPELPRGDGKPGQPYAEAARKQLSRLVGGRRVSLHCYEQDHYGRAVCDILLPEGDSANRQLVRMGLAWANQEKGGLYLRDPELLVIEDEARQARLGLWARTDVVPPWQWRYLCWKKSQC